MQRDLTVTPADLRQARNAALLALDTSYMRAYFPGAPEADLLEAMHKARYACPDLPRSARHASAQWLRERHLRDMLGEPVLPEGMLPR